MEMVRKSLILVTTAMARVKNKHLKKYQSQFQKGLMMVQELDLLEKVRQEQEVERVVIYIYLLMLNLTNYLKDLM